MKLMKKLKFCLRILKQRDGSLVQHAMTEMNLAWPNHTDKTNEMQEKVKENILELMTTLSTQGHSGFSAPYVIHLFKQLAMYDTILPLTGEDDEWEKTDDDGELLQNRRLSSVFKQGSQVYDVGSIVFQDGNSDGPTYTFSKLVGKVEFPYVQKRFEVVVPKDATPSEMIAALNARHIPFVDRGAVEGQPEA